MSLTVLNCIALLVLTAEVISLPRADASSTGSIKKKKSRTPVPVLFLEEGRTTYSR
jgi:hypothetical protein